MKILVIQTSFLGDVILATSVAEKLHQHFPSAQIDFMLRKGNESLFTEHPFIHKVIVWDKAEGKLSNLMKIASDVRKNKYDIVVNLHRFASSGFVVWRSGAAKKIGFNKNPFSFCYTTKVKHVIGDRRHEIDRNHELIKAITDDKRAMPHLYPSPADYDAVKQYKSEPYLCIAPSSVWFTKQYPESKWIEFVMRNADKHKIYLLGSHVDVDLCKRIAKSSSNVVNLAGKLSLLQSAALMKDAVRSFVNDSAPMHLASSVNAAVTAIFCSTVPAFGFGPLSDDRYTVQTHEELTCRPCGLHGFKACPKGHFMCATSIPVEALEVTLMP